jgi:arabinogalactan oligomer / maltooligosaccharide transport system substrate-binding protein
MLNKHTARIGTVLLIAVAAALVILAPGATAAKEQGRKVVIWADKDRKAAVENVARAWANRRGVEVDVVEKGFGDIRDKLGTVSPNEAPDVIVGAHDWTGELAANGLVQTLNLTRAVRRSFPAYSLEAFSYNGRLYGTPVALENVGLVVNTRLVKVPKTWAQLEKSALAFKRRNADNLGIAVPQGAGGDAYHMYPFFSGLGGYVFGKTRNGGLSAKRLGVANRTFLRNASLIDKWNRTGLINSKVDYNTAKNAFLKGNAAFWLTGPWESDTLKTSGLRFRIIQVPKIKFRAVPFLGVQGYMVTRYATGHGVTSLAKDLVGSYMTTAASQQGLAAANSRFPANRIAGRRVTDPVLAQFGRAGAGGVPMPNIPQMASVWGELGGAWVKATRGAGATPARSAFSTAARNIADKIGG